MRPGARSRTIRYRTDVTFSPAPIRIAVSISRSHRPLLLFGSFVRRGLTTTTPALPPSPRHRHLHRPPDDEEERACCDGALGKKRTEGDTGRAGAKRPKQAVRRKNPIEAKGRTRERELSRREEGSRTEEGAVADLKSLFLRDDQCAKSMLRACARRYVLNRVAKVGIFGRRREERAKRERR